MQMGQEMPPEAAEAFYVDESGCTPTLGEIEGMTQVEVCRLIDYRAVKRVITEGGEMRF